MFVSACEPGKTMRLTLRTLLAYLHQANLNLRATERIEAKVRESRAAQQLIADLQRLTSDPEASAFAADMVEGARDPNLISEYLDNALPDEQVEWFEKQCFESAVLLGEIAACHQILSGICGGETAAASAAVRQRIYGLGRFQFDRAHLPEQTEVRYLAGAMKPGGGAAGPNFDLAPQFAQPEAVFNLGPPPEERHRPEDWIVTLSGEDLEELRAESRSQWLPWLLLAAAMILLAAAVGWGVRVWVQAPADPGSARIVWPRQAGDQSTATAGCSLRAIGGGSATLVRVRGSDSDAARGNLVNHPCGVI